jgi:hypothetical protein
VGSTAILIVISIAALILNCLSPPSLLIIALVLSLLNGARDRKPLSLTGVTASDWLENRKPTRHHGSRT